MRRNTVGLIMLSIACILLAVFLAVSAAVIFREGSAKKAEDPKESIYTREIAAEKLTLAAPLFIVCAGLTVAGAVLGIRDEKAEKPVGRADAGYRPAGALRPKRRRMLQAAFIGMGLLFLLAGIFNHSARDVLYKAVAVCSECIGLG